MKAPVLPRKAHADLEALRRIFTVPEGDQSTLARLEKRISENLGGFLRDVIVAGDLSPQSIEKDFADTMIPEDPMFVSDQADFLLDKVVSQSVHVASPRFIGHMTSAVPYFMLTLAKIMTALNQNLVKIETSKAFTPLERQVIGMLHRLVFAGTDEFYNTYLQSPDHALGAFCAGGTIANLTAIWVARNQKLGPQDNFPGVGKAGLTKALKHYGYSDMAILVSQRGHYSLTKSANVLGLGEENIVRIPTSDQFKIDLKELKTQITRLQSEGVLIGAIIGVAGTTETGHIDPLAAMADIAGEAGCHFHVDAAWGGPVLFSRKYRHLLDGIERADSVIIDAHKQLYCPVGAGIVLFRDAKAQQAIEHHAKYIIRAGSRDLGKFTLEGSRSGMAMLVHSGLKVMGRSGYEILIDLGIGKAAQFAKMIRSHSLFELVSSPETNLLTYRYVPEEIAPLLRGPCGPGSTVEAVNELLNELTASIQKEQRAQGKTFVSRTTIEAPQYGGQQLTVFRVVLANPLTTRQILAEILDEQCELARRVIEVEGFAPRFAQLKPELKPCAP